VTRVRQGAGTSPHVWQPNLALGVVLAGGASRRFGQDKALFPLAGRPMASWGLEALRPHTDTQVVIANAPGVADSLGVRGRPDLVSGLGPLGGVLTALEWAEAEGREAIVILACDLPLVTPSLLSRILRAWEKNSGAVVPGSSGPLGFEPLCGAYAVASLPAARECAVSEDRSMERFLVQVGCTVVPADRLGTAAELDLAFKNVNTESDARWAEKVLRERASASPEVLSPRGIQPPS